VDKLVSLVMNNFFIVVIVVGLIYSLFFRKSPLEKRPPNRMPDFGGGQQRRPDSPPQRGVPMRTPPAKQEPQRSPPVRSAPPEPSRQPLSQQMAVEDAYEDKRISSGPSAGNVSARSGAVAATAEPAAEKLSREELARAVMWAEILGPPRARRPHRR
jgi:hypothetical protein